MPRDPEQQALLARLRDLASTPREQAAYALDLLERERRLAVVLAALAVLADHANPALRAPLLERYAHCAALPAKRDPGAHTRVALLHTLRPVLRPEDTALLETAATTYEYLPPGPSEVGAALRAAALVDLMDLDPERAAYHAVRLLADPRTTRMSGEPALTAARALAAQDHFLPLYHYVLYEPAPVSEVVSESLKSLTRLPDALLPDLVKKYGGSDDDMALAGLFDLLLAHPAGGAHSDFLLQFLRTTRRLDVYSYLVTAIVAGKPHGLLPPLLDLARAERDPAKRRRLAEALRLLRADPAVDALLRDLTG
jgi:hypothetical protein